MWYVCYILMCKQKQLPYTGMILHHEGFFSSLLKTMSPPKQIATGKRWFWMGKKSKLIYWIQQDRRTMLQLETTTSEVAKVFFASSLLQSLNPLQQRQTLGKLQGKIIILITLRWLKVIFLCVCFVISFWWSRLDGSSYCCHIILWTDVLAAVFLNTRKAIATEQTHSNIQKTAASPWSQPQTASY